MLLTHRADYLSIKKFKDLELPKLTVLTGLNGAGKTHFLASIKNGSTNIENITFDKIIEFNNTNFSLGIEPTISFSKIQDDRSKMFQIIENNIKIQNNYHLNEIRSIINQLTSFCIARKISFYQLSVNDFSELGFTKKLYTEYLNYINYVTQLVSNQSLSDGEIGSEIQKILKYLNKPIEDITRDELDSLHIPIVHKNDFLIIELGRIFTNYWRKFEQNQYNEFRNANHNESRKVLTETEFEKENGKKPWDLINEILLRFGSLDYKVNNPEGLERGHAFQLRLISKKDPNIIIGFENLSSGERVMMALVSSIYKSIIDKNFPKVLLLDEIDASLHPSMSKIMLDVIEEEFVLKNNINVILVTHSPSTVALAPQSSIYVMNKNSEERIVKSTNREALDILTEGFASLTNDETNLKVSYNISKATDYVFLTEGITDRIILESAWTKLEKTKQNFDTQDCFDAGFLRNLFARKEIFANYPNKTFIAIFDFDKEGFDAWNTFRKDQYDITESDPYKCLMKKSKKHNAYIMLLPVPNNDIQKQVIKNNMETFENNSHMPIELLFHKVEKLQDKFTNETQVGGGSLIKFTGDKVAFATKIEEECNVEDLKNIKPIFEKLKEIFK